MKMLAACASSLISILWACAPPGPTQAPVAGSELIAVTETRISNDSGGPLPTAPPPILYPPHDPEATYPVIRTWREVLEFEPYAYLRSLPGKATTPLDGVYAKVHPGDPQWWRCARCPDFMLAGGNWKLMLHQGTMRMYYEVTGFSTVASFTVQGDEIEIFNDPHCPYEVGLYSWELRDGSLQLDELQDTCAIHLRAENLTFQPWTSCQPPNTEAGISDHWIRPPGCG